MKFLNENIFGILFGVGIGKALNDDIEFGYANYIYRYGICGLLIYILFLSWGIY